MDWEAFCFWGRFLHVSFRPERLPSRRQKGWNMQHYRYRFSILCFVWLFLAGSAFAAATLRGIIKDPKGAQVPGATVRLLDAQGAEIASAVTDDQGGFHFDGLAPGNYTVRASLTGFRTATANAKPGETVQ